MNTAVLFALVVASWGFNPYAISLQLGPVAPEVLVAYRFAASGVLVVAAALALGRSLRFTLREHLYLALQGTLMFSLVDLLFYHAIVHIPTGLVQLVVSMMIVTNILLGALLLGCRCGGTWWWARRWGSPASPWCRGPSSATWSSPARGRSGSR